MTDQRITESRSDTEYYPAWLGQSILWDEFPWEAARTCKVQEFLEQFTLHDSEWVIIYHDFDYEYQSTLVIRWDAVWLPDEIAKSTSIVCDWPLLLIKLEGVKQISTLGYEKIGGTPRGISSAEVEEIEDKFVFVIHDHTGGSVEIVFDGAAHFLALNRDKLPLKI